MNATEIIEFILNKIGDIDDSDMGILSLLKTEFNDIIVDKDLSDEDKAISILQALLRHYDEYKNECLENEQSTLNALKKFNQITELNIQNVKYIFNDETYELDLIPELSKLTAQLTDNDFPEINKAISELSNPKPKPPKPTLKF